MTELDTFDRDLAAALRDYAGEVPATVDASRVAAVAMAAPTAGVRWWDMGRADRRRVETRWLLVGAVLATLTLAASALWVGRPIPIPAAALQVPAELAGTWNGAIETDTTTREYRLDFEADPLIAGEAQLGHAASIEPISPGFAWLTIQAPEPCGAARYKLSYVGANTLWFAEGDDPCPARATILQAGNWLRFPTPQSDDPGLVVGTRATADGFGEPFSFTVTRLDPAYGNPHVQEPGMPGVFGYVSAPSAWALQFFDDWPMNITPCDATQRLADIPSTLEAVEAWLAEPGVRPSPVALNVDGRRALRFDLDWESGCPPEIRPYVALGYGGGTIEPVLRIYAIETGDDIILAQLSADAGSRAPVLRIADRFIETIAFVGAAPTAEPPGTVPAGLSGGFAPLTQNVADPPGQHFLDFEGPALVVDPLGEGLAWLGRAISYEPVRENAFAVTIAGPEPCGVGRYTADVSEPVGVTGTPGIVRLTLVDDACADRAAILEEGPWKGMSSPYGSERELFPGQRYVIGSFGEPFAFAARHLNPALGRSYFDTVHEPGDFNIHNHTLGEGGDWAVRFIDDWQVWANPCADAGSLLADIPSTPGAVAAWLEAIPGLPAGPSTELFVDGRVAVRLDLRLEPACGPRQPPLLAGDNWSERPKVRIYGIDTGDDTILAIVASHAESQDSVLANVDGLIESLTFE